MLDTKMNILYVYRTSSCTLYVRRVFTRFAKQQEKNRTWHKRSHQLTTYLEIDYIYYFLIPRVQDKLVFQQQIFGMIPCQWYARNQNRTVSPISGNMFNKSCNFQQFSWCYHFAKNWDFRKILRKRNGKKLTGNL